MNAASRVSLLHYLLLIMRAVPSVAWHRKVQITVHVFGDVDLVEVVVQLVHRVVHRSCIAHRKVANIKRHSN